MRSMIGFWMISEAIAFVIIFVTGIELNITDKVKMILATTLFLTMLCIGVYLMVGR